MGHGRAMIGREAAKRHGADDILFAHQGTKGQQGYRIRCAAVTGILCTS